jgi:tRNA threonylcarbamoyladenosine biosynthesis protein TsaB
MDLEEPRILLLETSSQPGLVAVAAGAHLLGMRRLDEARRHARDLVPAVAALLADQGWKPRDLQAVAVSRGPGSYTGLRVGIISAKTLAYATGCKLLTLETFAILAAQVPAQIDRLAVLSDAQQDKVYVQEFDRSAAGLVPCTALRIQQINAWVEAQREPIWASGQGLRKWAGSLSSLVRPVDPQLWDPQPESLLRLALVRLSRNEQDDLWSAEPLYLRPSAAEEQQSRRDVDRS